MNAAFSDGGTQNDPNFSPDPAFQPAGYPPGHQSQPPLPPSAPDAPADHGAGNIDKIRDILFGSNMRDYEHRFARLEEDVGILRGAAQNRMIGRKRPLTMLNDSIHINERAHIVFIKHLDLVHFMRGAEAVEEMQERDARF